jgi:type II secretory ATPase GspE/PulE/Tfp pilus assembly ATPase PilB-like protein
MAPETVLYQATGCQECRQTGYHGRRAVFEMMAISHPIRQKILQHCSSGELKQIAQKEGMRTLSQDGWRLVEAGVTTPDEILRVTKDDVLSFR